MIANLWAKIPGEEQKLILGLVVAVITAGGLRMTNNSVSLDWGVIAVVATRYFTDAVQRISPPAA